MKKISFLLLTGIMMMLYTGCTNAQTGTVIGGVAGAVVIEDLDCVEAAMKWTINAAEPGN